MPIVHIWQTDDITSSGPDVFSNTQDANGGAVGNSTFVIAGGATMTAVEVKDDDLFLNDNDVTSQVLITAATVNGTLFPGGTAFKVDYAYVVRPAGSSDPADNITVYGVKVANNIEAVVSDAQLLPGVTYSVISIASNSPSAAYDGLFVCFARGSRLATDDGVRPVEALRPGDLVATADHGPQPILWIGSRRVRAEGAAAPVVFAPGALGNRRRLALSQQHRVVVNQGGKEVLVAAKALIGWPGVAVNPGGIVEYFHLLFARHEIVFAEGARVESLNPGPEAWKSLGASARTGILALCPDLARGPMPMARPVIKPGVWRRLAAADHCSRKAREKLSVIGLVR